MLSELVTFPSGHQRAASHLHSMNRTVLICPSHSLHSFSSLLIVLSCSDSYYGTVKLCSVQSMLYLIRCAVQKSKRTLQKQILSRS